MPSDSREAGYRASRGGFKPEHLSAHELLEQWREAARSAELAEQLAELAKESAERSDRGADAAEAIAKLAERAASHAERAARVARQAAVRAAAFARDNRAGRLADADWAATSARDAEIAAGERYHDAEREAVDRHQPEDDRLNGATLADETA